MTSNLNIDSIPQVDLNDGHEIPQLGFGTFQIPPPETADAVAHALRAGYRHIDTAAAYGNEAGVAAGIRDAGVDRREVFITTKLWNGDHGAARAASAFDRSLERPGVDYVDLYLIHWPVPSQDDCVETWEALTELRTAGRARSIGVSNFAGEHLERIVHATGVVPAVNQIELHPSFQQAALRRLHEDRGIVTEAWSPLAQQAILDDETITGIAESKDRTPAQVVLRWHLQLGNIVIPKSVTPERIEENIGVFDFELSDHEMSAIKRLDTPEGRIGPDPQTFTGG